MAGADPAEAEAVNATINAALNEQRDCRRTFAKSPGRGSALHAPGTFLNKLPIEISLGAISGRVPMIVIETYFRRVVFAKHDADT